MPANKVPSSAKSGLERACQKAVDKVKKAAPGEKNEKKLAEMLNKQLCKEVDGKLLKMLAEELAKQAKGASAKAPANAPPKVDAKPTMSTPGSGAYSFKIPLGKFDVMGDKKKDGKLELQIWGDPKDFKSADKGVMLHFTVTNW